MNGPDDEPCCDLWPMCDCDIEDYDDIDAPEADELEPFDHGAGDEIPR